MIAGALLSLGESDVLYFDYLAEPAREVAQSDMPFPLLVDERGQLSPRELSPTFVAWCGERQLEPTQTSFLAIYELHLDLMFLALARDIRSSDIFLRALDAPNFYTVNQGITGLALLRQRTSIAPIVRAAERMPVEIRQRPAAALMLFDVPEARELARRFVPDEKRLLAWAESYRQMLPRSQARPEN